MPSANLNLVRSIYAGWDAATFGSAEWADPEIEFVFTDRPEPGSYTEHGGMAQAKRDWLSVSPPMNKRERHASGRSAPRARWRLCVGRLGGLVNEYASAA
jgi:hypothetical protein